MIRRILSIDNKKSFFLFGPRQTGKSTFVNTILEESDLYINLLPQRNFLDYSKNPDRFRQEVLTHLKKNPGSSVVIDEVQKIPALLDEVHDLIETEKIRFILTGSSARKLKRGAANLLAGRAYTYFMFPLTFLELKDIFDLEKVLKMGSLPALWFNDENPQKFLESYVNTYIREEIQAEGIVRAIAPFSKFLDIAAALDTEIVSISSIARECHVSSKTVTQYYTILEDTFLASRVEPWTKSVRKRLVSHPKYYFFDCGPISGLTHSSLDGPLDFLLFGKRFEQFIFNQMRALNSYWNLGFRFYFWRTNTGTEVDFILVKNSKILAAIEVKSSQNIHSTDTRGLMSFQSENSKVPCFIVSREESNREIAPGIKNIFWEEFLTHSLKKLG